MKVMRAGGIDFDHLRQAGVGDFLAKDTVRCGASADISHADEQDAEGLWHGVSMNQ
jgi:hypothetical protein